MKKFSMILGAAAFLFLQFNCSSSDNSPSDPIITDPDPPVNPGVSDVDFWLTKGDETAKLAKQTTVLTFTTTANTYANIEVNEMQTFQTIDGFGYTLTGGSVQVINQMSAAKKQEVLQDLFNTTTGIGISYLRISIGASDLNASAFTYNDMPSGQTDPTLANFSMARDAAVIAMLKEILAINPNIKIMATPWSAPLWMKTNNNFINGSLKPEYYQTYAQYFVKYIQAMQAEGISITAVTPQNEPLNPHNEPSMVMTAEEQRDFIKNNLGPSFQAAGITTKIIAYDHNCDMPQYPLTILNDPAAKAFTDGSAFHLYAGDINNLSAVHNAHPDRNIYFTEQYTAATGNFGGDLKWHLKNVIIGSMRNWSKNALEWNLANDASFGPHTPGGCLDCKGAITINGDFYSKNVAYYNIAHASKFVPVGSVRIGSNIQGNLYNVAFKTPAGKIVLIVENDGTAFEIFNIKYNGKWVTASLDAGSVATYTWPAQ